MKKIVLAVTLCCTFGVGIASADIWGNIGRAVGKAWEDVKRESTNVAHNTEKTVSKAWEDTKGETTKGLKNVTFLFNSDCRQEINGDGQVNTEFEISNKKNERK
jgi:hypothetical protein